MRRRGSRLRVSSASNADHHYIFNESAGNLIDINGTADMTVFETTRGNGEYFFDGVNDYCTVNNDLVGSAFPISVTAEVKKESSLQEFIYFSNWVEGLAYSGIVLALKPGIIECSYGNGLGAGASSRRLFASNDFDFDTNYHKISIEIVDNLNVNLWVDGVSLPMSHSSGSATSMSNSGKTFLFKYLGAYQSGSIRKLSTFKRLLQPSER